ncbi:MAG: excinuclease ABC subunit UvrA, partial [Bacteroidales bacterium]|nr:excinuclease ABC subunit UvrA [Bacteroidales bacterium]
MNNSIIIKGASEHNLKNINLEIPKKKIVVFTGISGSGKSSLVFDTICAEAQRQLIETFNTFARRRLPKISKPHVEDIENLSTAMVIDQKRLGTNLRSTVGTVTEIYTNLRMLYSRVGDPFIGWSNSYSFNNPEGMCPVCNGLGKEMDIDLNQIVDWEKSVKDGAIIQPEFKKGGYYWRIMIKCGFFDSDKPVKDFTEEELNNLLYLERSEFENEHQGEKYTQRFEGVITLLKRRYYNQEADSNAYTRFFKYKKCSACHGTRINQKARSVKVNGVTIPELVFLEMPDLLAFLKTIKDDVAQPLITKMSSCIENLIEIGVGYLSLHRPVSTLSGGESQRVKMAKQLDCNLVDLMYILDEPTTGLHARDVNHLIKMLYELRDKGNTVLVVEHDTEVMKSSDYIIDIGPEAGAKGGIIQFAGIFNDLLKT